MLVAGLGFAMMGACVKLGANHFSNTELVFYRSLFGLLSILVIIIPQRLPISNGQFKKHLARSVVGFVSLVLFFYAIAHLPLATAITLNYTSPMFLALIAPYFLAHDPSLKHKNKTVNYLCLLLGFIGIVLMLQPIIQGQLWLPASLGLLSGFGAAIAYAHVKQLGLAGEPDWRTVYYFTLISTIASGAWMLSSDFHAPKLQDMPLLLGLSISATLAQLAMTRAYRTGHTLTVASLAYSTVVFSAILGAIFWHEHLSLVEYVGIGLVVIAGLISMRHH